MDEETIEKKFETAKKIIHNFAAYSKNEKLTFSEHTERLNALEFLLSRVTELRQLELAALIKLAEDVGNDVGVESLQPPQPKQEE